MTQTLAEVFAVAEKDFTSGRYPEALRGYVAIIDAAPRYTRARYRVADTLLNPRDEQTAQHGDI